MISNKGQGPEYFFLVRIVLLLKSNNNIFYELTRKYVCFKLFRVWLEMKIKISAWRRKSSCVWNFFCSFCDFCRIGFTRFWIGVVNSFFSFRFLVNSLFFCRHDFSPKCRWIVLKPRLKPQFTHVLKFQTGWTFSVLKFVTARRYSKVRSLYSTLVDHDFGIQKLDDFFVMVGQLVQTCVYGFKTVWKLFYLF